MNINFFPGKFALAGGCAALLTVQSASAATIVWQGAENITVANDVRVSGTLVAAYSFGGTAAGATAATVNGVPFVTVPANVVQGSVSSSGALYGYGGFEGGTGQPFASLPASYRTLNSWGLYGGANTISLTLSNLTAGKTYLLQFWVNDSSGSAGPNHNAAKFGLGVNFSPPVKSKNALASRGTLGQYVVGYLTLGSAETGATITVSPGSGGATIVNAMQIRTAERTAWLADAKYGIYLNFAPGGVLPPAWDAREYSISAMINDGSDDSPWSKAVAAFDVNAFANQAAEAGAGYVILTNGVTYGYYNSPNSHYEGIGGLSPGEFTSRRDLISDLADALQPRGIKLMVYLAGEGPWYANVMTRKSDGVPVEMRKLTFANVYPLSPNGPAYDYRLRNNLNAMITEWSTRWGSKVVGWWFDGCWPLNTGYGTYADNNAGLSNLNALIAAAKFGNPDSMVAVNAGADNYSSLTADQDYLSGECAQHYTQYGKFSRYPSSPYISHGGKEILWHTLSFLGVRWRTPEQKYVNEELINYISSVNRVGGIVTLDVAFHANGTIVDTHFNQLKRLKAALKPGNLPAVPYDEPATFVNLALFKPAYLKSNNSGEYALGPASGQYQAHAGVDGDFTTKAQAGGEYAWNYTVDLEEVKSFDRVVAHFHSPNYATSYQILYSNNGLAGAAGNWQHLAGTATTYSATNPGMKVHDAPSPVSGRYIRIKALAPNAQGQPGGSMGLSEFEVYNVDGSAQTSKDTVWVDENVPAGASLSTGGSGVWTWAGVLDANWSSFGNPHPAHGMRVHWSPTATGWNEHGFESTVAPLKLGASDNIYCDVWLDGSQMPSEILLTWKDSTGSSEHRAFWGDDLISVSGAPNSPGRRYVGPIPEANKWVRLTIPASEVGLSNKTVVGMSFATFHGRALFDRSGRTTVVGYSSSSPQTLTGTAGNAQAKLRWNPVVGATSYNVMVALSTGGPYVLRAASVTGTEYLDANLTNGTSYYYVIAANVGGAVGPNSPEAKVTPKVP